MCNTTVLGVKILSVLSNECMLTDEVQVRDYVLTRKEQIIKNHVDNVFPIKEPGERGGHPKYWMTKLDPHNKKKDKKVYGKSKEELEVKVIAYYLKIQDDSKVTVRDILIAAVDEIVKKKVTQKEFNSTMTCLNKIAEKCDYEHVEVCDIKAIIAVYRKVKLSGKHIFVENQKQSKNLAFNRKEASKIVSNALRHPTYKSLAIALLIITGLRAGELLALRMFMWMNSIYGFIRLKTQRPMRFLIG